MYLGGDGVGGGGGVGGEWGMNILSQVHNLLLPCRATLGANKAGKQLLFLPSFILFILYSELVRNLHVIDIFIRPTKSFYNP